MSNINHSAVERVRPLRETDETPRTAIEHIRTEIDSQRAVMIIVLPRDAISTANITCVADTLEDVAMMAACAQHFIGRKLAGSD